MIMFKHIIDKTAILLLAFFILGLIVLKPAAAANVTFKFIVVNPSTTKAQEIQVKQYLPKEVTPDDIVDLGGLDLEYDTDKATYYVYKNSLPLAPKEIRTFEVEIRDVWLVPESELSLFEKQTKSILTYFENTPYYAQGKVLADGVITALNTIRRSQVSETDTREQHIGIYRENLQALARVKEDIARMEKILVTAGGPQAPEMLASAKIKADAPSKTMTWIVIFVIIIFIGLLGGVMFFTWQRQSRLTKEALLESKKAAFGSSEEKSTDDRR